MAQIGKKCHQNGINPDIQRTKGDATTLRIYNHRMREFASRAILQVINGCAAHNSGQVLMLRGKICLYSSGK
jgi:hypothetical protein